MAERRMFAKTIIDSDAFLDMPLSAQSLYFHLSMRADDDGFINNPKKVQRMIGAADDDLKLLVLKKFIIPFETGIVVIKHWKIHNYIRQDRYKETVYQEEKRRLNVEENKAYTLRGIGTEGTPETPGLPYVTPAVDQRETQVRLGKDRLGKDRLGKDRLGEERLGGSGGTQEAATHAANPVIAAVVSDYLNRINPAASPTSLQELADYAEELGEAVCKRAFDIALDEKKSTWSYIRAILRDKAARGIKCLADWDEKCGSRGPVRQQEKNGTDRLREMIDRGDFDDE